jgi:hypothetical protein
MPNLTSDPVLRQRRWLARDDRGRFKAAERDIFANCPTRTLQVSVKRGAELLDRRRPGWYFSIDLDTLNISDSKKCILGQLNAYDIPNDMIRTGFMGWTFSDDDVLTRCWKHQIRERRKHGSTQTKTDSLVRAANGVLQASRDLSSRLG